MHKTTSIIPPLKDIDRAILLHGNRCKSELRSKAKKELEDLIGEYPEKVEVAAAWHGSFRSPIGLCRLCT